MRDFLALLAVVCCLWMRSLVSAGATNVSTIPCSLIYANNKMTCTSSYMVLDVLTQEAQLTTVPPYFPCREGVAGAILSSLGISSVPGDSLQVGLAKSLLNIDTRSTIATSEDPYAMSRGVTFGSTIDSSAADKVLNFVYEYADAKPLEEFRYGKMVLPAVLRSALGFFLTTPPLIRVIKNVTLVGRTDIQFKPVSDIMHSLCESISVSFEEKRTQHLGCGIQNAIASARVCSAPLFVTPRICALSTFVPSTDPYINDRSVHLEAPQGPNPVIVDDVHTIQSRTAYTGNSTSDENNQLKKMIEQGLKDGSISKVPVDSLQLYTKWEQNLFNSNSLRNSGLEEAFNTFHYTSDAEQLDTKMHSWRYKTVLRIANENGLVEITPECRKYFGFVVGNESYTFNKLPTSLEYGEYLLRQWLEFHLRQLPFDTDEWIVHTYNTIAIGGDTLNIAKNRTQAVIDYLLTQGVKFDSHNSTAIPTLDVGRRLSLSGKITSGAAAGGQGSNEKKKLEDPNKNETSRILLGTFNASGRYQFAAPRRLRDQYSSLFSDAEVRTVKNLMHGVINAHNMTHIMAFCSRTRRSLWGVIYGWVTTAVFQLNQNGDSYGKAYKVSKLPYVFVARPEVNQGVERQPACQWLVMVRGSITMFERSFEVQTALRHLWIHGTSEVLAHEGYLKLARAFYEPLLSYFLADISSCIAKDVEHRTAKIILSGFQGGAGVGQVLALLLDHELKTKFGRAVKVGAVFFGPPPVFNAPGAELYGWRINARHLLHPDDGTAYFPCAKAGAFKGHPRCAKHRGGAEVVLSSKGPIQETPLSVLDAYVLSPGRIKATDTLRTKIESSPDPHFVEAIFNQRSWRSQINLYSNWVATLQGL